MNIRRNIFKLFVVLLIFFEPTNLVLQGNAERSRTAHLSKNSDWPLNTANPILFIYNGVERNLNTNLLADSLAFKVNRTQLSLNLRQHNAPMYLQESSFKTVLRDKKCKRFNKKFNEAKYNRISLLNLRHYVSAFPVSTISNNFSLAAGVVMPAVRVSATETDGNLGFLEPLSLTLIPFEVNVINNDLLIATATALPTETVRTTERNAAATPTVFIPAAWFDGVEAEPIPNSPEIYTVEDEPLVETATALPVEAVRTAARVASAADSIPAAWYDGVEAEPIIAPLETDVVEDEPLVATATALPAETVRTAARVASAADSIPAARTDTVEVKSISESEPNIGSMPDDEPESAVAGAMLPIRESEFITDIINALPAFDFVPDADTAIFDAEHSAVPTVTRLMPPELLCAAPVADVSRDECVVASLMPASREIPAAVLDELAVDAIGYLPQFIDERGTAEETLQPAVLRVVHCRDMHDILTIPTSVSMVKVGIIPANLRIAPTAISCLPTVTRPATALVEPFIMIVEAQPILAKRALGQSIGAELLVAGSENPHSLPTLDLESFSDEVDSSEIDEAAIVQSLGGNSSAEEIEAIQDKKVKKRHRLPKFYFLDIGPLSVLKAFINSTLPNIHERITQLKQKQKTIRTEQQAEQERLEAFLCKSQQKIAHLENNLKVNEDVARYLVKKKGKKQVKIEHLNSKITEDLQAGINTLVRKVQSIWTEKNKTLKAQLQTLTKKYGSRSASYEHLHQKIGEVEQCISPEYKQELVQKNEAYGYTIASLKEKIANLTYTLATEIINQINFSYHKVKEHMHVPDEDKENRKPVLMQPARFQNTSNSALKEFGFNLAPSPKNKKSIHNAVERFLQDLTSLAASSPRAAQEKMQSFGDLLKVDQKVYIFFDELLLEHAEYTKTQVAHNRILKEMNICRRETAAYKKQLKNLQTQKMAVENEIRQIDSTCKEVKQQYKTCKGIAKHLQEIEVTPYNLIKLAPYCTKNNTLLNLQKEIEAVAAKLKKSQDFLQVVTVRQENMHREKTDIERKLKDKKKTRKAFKQSSREKQTELSAKLFHVQQNLQRFTYATEHLNDLSSCIAELEEDNTGSIPAPQYDARAHIFYTSIAELEMRFAETAELGFLLPIYTEWKQRAEEGRLSTETHVGTDRDEAGTDAPLERANIEFIHRKLQTLDLFNDF